MIQGNLNEAMVQSALTVIPSLITMITSISTLTQGWTAVTQGVSGALNFLAANPIILVVAGIAALIAGLIWAYQNCEPFRNAINAIASVLGGALSTAISAVYGALKWLWDTVLVPLGQFVVSVFAAYWQGLVLVWTNYVLPAVNAVKGALEWFWNNILVPLGNYVGGALLAAWNAFAGGISWAYNNLIKPVIDAISWAYNNILKPIGDFFGGIGKGISDWWGGVTGGISSWWSGVTGGGGQPSLKIPGAQHGGIVTRPTLLWAGEAGPEAIVPLSRGFGSVNVTINIEGSVDKATAELAAQLVGQKLRSVIVEASSSGASSTMKRIRRQSEVF
jgi:phage-related protein